MSYIYIIGPKDHVGKPLKVGVSVNPTRRISNLQTGHSEKLKIHYQREVDDAIVYTMERLIHKELSFHRTLNEWFDIPLEDLRNDVDFVFMRYEDVTNLKTKYQNRHKGLIL